MASVIDSHPQKQKIIDAILAGETVRKIAAWAKPPVSFNAIQRYKAAIVKPAIQQSQAVARIINSTAKQSLTAEEKQAVQDAVQAAPVLAVRELRLARLQDRANRLDLIMNERAVDMASAPGGKSGLLARQLKQLGSGKDAQVVEEYKLDTGLLAEFREHEKQAAIELGQWQESAGLGATVQVVVPIQIVNGQPAPVTQAEVIDVQDLFSPEDCAVELGLPITGKR